MIRVLFLSLCLLAVVNTPARAEILAIKEVTSSGGLKAWLVEDHTIPVISLRFSFRDSGSANDPADRQGLARLLSNTMDEGAGELNSSAFQGELNDLSISLGFSASRDEFGGSVKTLSKNRARAFELLGLALTKPRFDEDAVERMRLANLSRIRSDMNDPDWMAARLFNAILFKGHPYEMNSGGTLTSMATLTAEDLRNFYKSALSKDRLVVSVAGDITGPELAQVLDQVFGQLPATAQSGKIVDTDLPKGGTIALLKKDVPQTVIQMAMPGIRWEDPDYHVAEVLNFVLGGAGFGSRLTETIREKNGLTYGIYSGLSVMDHASLISIGTSTRNNTVKQLLDLAKAEIAALAQTEITPQELHSAKTYLIGSVPLDLTSTDRISGYMQSFQMEGLPADYLDQRATAIKAVTSADVLRVAKRLLKPEALIVVMVGNPEDISPTDTISKLPNVE